MEKPTEMTDWTWMKTIFETFVNGNLSDAKEAIEDFPEMKTLII